MKTHLFPLKICSLFLFILFSCSPKTTNIDQEHLNGYWEIKEVQMPQGVNKEFTANVIVDHIQLEGNRGTRIKVVPQTDGSFSTNGMAETFEIRRDNDSLKMHYTTPYDTWEEVILEAQDSILVIQNKDKKIFTYKRFYTPSLNK